MQDKINKVTIQELEARLQELGLTPAMAMEYAYALAQDRQALLARLEKATAAMQAAGKTAAVAKGEALIALIKGVEISDAYD